MKNDSEFYKSNKLNLLVAAIVLLAINLGCNFSCGKNDFQEITSDQTAEEGNKLVREGNAVVEKATQSGAKAEALSSELLGSENLKKVENVEKYKEDNKAKFDELIKLCEDSAKDWDAAAAKFEQVSKMNLNEKFKEFNAVLAQGHRKTAEMQKADAGLARAYLAEKDPEKHTSIFIEYNKKYAEMTKELADLKEKSAKIRSDNPDVFKK